MNLTVLQDGSEQIHYDNPNIPIYVRHGDLRSMSNMSALCHWHDDVEILIPLEGHLSYNINGRTVSPGEGDAIFVNARQLHYGFSADGSDCNYVCITFRPQLLCGMEGLQRKFILPVLSSPQVPYILLRKDNPAHRELISSLRQVAALYQAKAEGFELLALSQILLFWHGLFTCIAAELDRIALEDHQAPVIRKMLEYIRTHYNEKITLDSIANAGGVCRTKCCQLFRNLLSMSPNDYLNSFRLEKSMELLKSTRMSVTEIAAECGYNSTSYFTEQFTRAKGCTPTQYRKQ